MATKGIKIKYCETYDQYFLIVDNLASPPYPSVEALMADIRTLYLKNK